MLGVGRRSAMGQGVRTNGGRVVVRNRWVGQAAAVRVLKRKIGPRGTEKGGGAAAAPGLPSLPGTTQRRAGPGLARQQGSAGLRGAGRARCGCPASRARGRCGRTASAPPRHPPPCPCTAARASRRRTCTATQSVPQRAGQREATGGQRAGARPAGRQATANGTAANLCCCSLEPPAAAAGSRPAHTLPYLAAPRPAAGHHAPLLQRRRHVARHRQLGAAPRQHARGQHRRAPNLGARPVAAARGREEGGQGQTACGVRTGCRSSQQQQPHAAAASSGAACPGSAAAPAVPPHPRLPLPAGTTGKAHQSTSRRSASSAPPTGPAPNTSAMPSGQYTRMKRACGVG